MSSSSLAKNSLIYASGSALSAAIGLLTIPISTYALSPDEFGSLELLSKIGSLLLILVLMGFNNAFVRFFFDKEGEAWQRKVTSTVLVFVLASCAAITLLTFALKDFILDSFGLLTHVQSLFYLVMIYAPLEVLINIGMLYLQVNKKARVFVACSLTRSVVQVSLTYYFLHIQQTSIEGVLYAQLIAASIFAICFLTFFIRWTRLIVSLEVLRELIKFGAPYLPASICVYIISNSDRYFLSNFSTLEQVGIYALALKIGGMATMLFQDSFNKVWAPFLFTEYKNQGGEKRIARAIELYWISSLYVALGLSAFAPLVFNLLADSSYSDAILLMPVVALAFAIKGVADLADAGILIAKKTYLKPLIFGSAAIIAITANYLLIPPLGGMGASLATLISFSCILAINHILSNRYYKIDINLAPIAISFAVFSLLYIPIYLAYNNDENLTYLTTLAVISCSLAPACLWFFNIITREEKEKIISLAVKLSKRRA